MVLVLFNLHYIFHIIILIGTILKILYIVYIYINNFRLFQQETMARCGSVSDDLMFLSNLNSDSFQRMGILAAFDSWERTKRFVY
jgi:hypothetical protein